MQWRLLSEKIPQSLPELEQLLLTNRGILEPEAFFKPPAPSSISLESAGFDLEQVRLAKKRILTAIKKQQKILVFGDYDADGICSTAIMWETLNSLGAKALPFIPEREKHGYGLSLAALAELSAHPLPDLIITVDTGIVAHEAIKQLVSKGVEVIITDHHQPETTLPPALAVVHTTAVCGTAVAWFMARELAETEANNKLDLVALATVSDLMPLRDINRSLVFHGLKQLNQTKRLGLQKLIEASGLTGKTLDAGSIGYALAPRINAMGRLSHGLDALRLLCTTNKTRAIELASLVDETNADRQQMTEDLLQLAREQVRSQKNESLLIAYSPDFHEGVIGLIAGKLTEWFAKPAIVISMRGELAKGSARSVPGVNITELIRTAREHLLEVGGHPMAAGFGFEPAKLDALMKQLFEYARINIDASLLQKTLNIDCTLPFSLVNENTVAALQKFAPFGQGNHEPVFKLEKLTLVEVKQIGAQQQHLKLILQDKSSNVRLQALLWGKGEVADQLELKQLVNVVGQLQLNQWQDRTTVQLIVKDLQPVEANL
jgi:single-stranded-DNA-specific exonuclease